MTKILVLQLRASLATLEELQQHEQNPDKYVIYEDNKKKLLSQINALLTSDFHTEVNNNNGSKPYGITSNKKSLQQSSWNASQITLQ